MSTRETMTVIDGVLGPRPERWLAQDVELWDVERQELVRGRAAVAARLGELLGLLTSGGPDDTRLTIDVGRGVAEWISAAIACAFEIEDGSARNIRVYYDAHRAG